MLQLSRLSMRWKGIFRYMSSTGYGSLSEGVQLTLQSIVGKENISTSPSVLEQHGKDESYHQVLPPDVVVYPESLKQVQELARLCSLSRIPLIPFGTGTGLEGGVGASEGGVCVDLTKMDSIIEVEVDDFFATVEPGVTRKSLNSYIRDSGLQFPVGMVLRDTDPGADASLCGMAATNASGTNAVRYGAMRENVLNLQVVLADGSVIHTAGLKGRARKRSAGYNLTNLFVGSEGTLGLITQATLKLHGVPEATVAAVCPFPDMKSAVTTTVETLQSGIPIAKIEFLDGAAVEITNKYFGMDYPVAPTLFLEFTGFQQSVDEQTRLVSELALNNGALEFIWEKDHEARAELWKARHNSWYASLASEPGKKGCSTDVCVPITKLPEVLLQTQEDCEKAPFSTSIIGHVGDGNFHCMFLLNPDSVEEMNAAKELSVRIGRQALMVGGTCTGEHGIGRGKRELLMEEMGDEGIELMKRLKRTLDPQLIMNPGKVLTF